MSVHCLTVVSREAEKSDEKLGKVTTRTLVAYRQLPLRIKEVYCELGGDRQVMRSGGFGYKRGGGVGLSRTSSSCPRRAAESLKSPAAMLREAQAELCWRRYCCCSMARRDGAQKEDRARMFGSGRIPRMQFTGAARVVAARG